MTKGSKTEAEAEVQTDSMELDEAKAQAGPVETRWTVGRWGELEQWQCALCPFDTLDGAAAIEAHWLAEHAPPPPPLVEKIQIYDRFGNPVN